MHVTRRSFLLTGTLASGAAAVWLSQKSGPVAAAAGQTVSVRQFGAIGDGVRDDTMAFQRAHDALRGGGTVIVPAGTYSVDRVRITNRGVRFALDAAATVRKRGAAGLASRGIFLLESLPNAQFALAGGRIDLNGEGPMGIGTPGRIPNNYASQTVPSIIALAGPTNAAIYALEASGISVTGTTIVNSGENGLLFRNCADVTVADCEFSNLANYGVELSFIERAPVSRLASAFTPGSTTVRNCRFTDIDDYGLGSGNGAGVGGGGAAGRPGRILVDGCTFTHCQRDVHFEMHAPARADDITVRGIRSTGARQGSIGLVGVARPRIENCVIVDAGAAPTALLGANFPEIYGVVVSGGAFSAAVNGVEVTDDRAIRSAVGRGSIGRGSRTLTAAGALFEAGDVGSLVGIDRGNPRGTAYVGRIAQVLSPTRVQLDLPAGADVRNARVALGGNTRSGMVLRAGRSAAIERATISAGAVAATGGEPPAAGIVVDGVDSEVVIAGSQITAPRRAGKAPTAILTRRGRVSLSGSGNRLSGFAENLSRF